MCDSGPSPRALFLFDLDGTLVRGGDQEHVQAFDHSLQAVYGVEATLAAVAIADYLDRPILHAAMAPFDLDDATIDAGFDEVMQVMAKKYRELLGSLALPDRLLPGAIPCVDRCLQEGHSAVVATGSSRLVARQKLNYIGLDHLPDGAFGDEVDHRHELYPLALMRVNTPVDHVIVVGDTPSDIATARRAGHHVVAVASGRWSEDQLGTHAPDLLLPDLTHHHRIYDWLATL